jgi:hypothetical protein
MSRTRRWTLALVAVLALRSPGLADEPFVDPTDIRSSAGDWSLHVEPSAPGGEGGAKYRMTHGGALAWEATIEYTLRESVVSSSGVVVGYAYDNGYMGWGGKIVVLVIGEGGKRLLTEPHDRDGPAMAIDPPPPGEPRGAGVLIDEEGKRAIVRVSARDDRNAPAEWWVYSIEDGHSLGKQVPPPPQKGDLAFSREIDARLVPGTGLIGVHWVAYEQGVQSAVFQLIDRDGKIVWSTRIEAEYSGRPKYWNWWKLLEEHVQQLEVGPSEVATVSYSQGKRTRYAISKDDAGAWVVKETGKEAAEPVAHPRSSGSALELKTVPGELKRIGEVSLGTPAARRDIDGVSGICFDDRGRMGWVRWTRAEKPASQFVLVDREGKVVSETLLELPEVKSSGAVMCAWLEKDRWVLARSVYVEDQTHAQAWFLDAAAGKLTPIEGFQGGHLKRICRRPEGDAVGFVVLGSLHGSYTIRDQINCYDHEGKLTSSRTEEGYGRGLFIMDVAVLTDGTLALLTGAGQSDIHLFRPGKDEPEVWHVPEAVADAAGASQSYMADLRADKDGGLIVYDSANENLLHRLDKNGKRWQSVHVAGPKGEKFRLYDAFAVDPDGRIWASDHHRLFRVGESGRADVALGGPAEGSLGEPCALTMDAKGRIYVLENGTAAVHVFDETGKPIRVMRPEPTDTTTQDELSWIVVEADGRVRFRMGYEAPIVTFDAEGKRIGVEKPKNSWDESRPEWEPVRGGGWEQGTGKVRRLNADGSVAAMVSYRPDGPSLVSVRHAAAAPDGSLALLCTRETPGGWFAAQNTPAWLCFYGPDGGGRGVVRVNLPMLFDRLTFDGTRAMLSDYRGVTVVPLPLTTQAKRYDLPGEHDVWSVLTRPDGTLATWKHGSREVQKWASPE